MSHQDYATVVIVGGGIAGMTLAKVLEQCGISYALWEARDAIVFAGGASVGLLPNGLRILDQIGVAEQVEQFAAPHDLWELRDANGNLLNSLTGMRRFKEELGYTDFFVERQHVLEILYETLTDKSRIHTSKRVSSVESFPTHAVVTANDGSKISCEFVIGADGVRSAVRRSIEAALPNLVKNPHNFGSTYNCVFGVSKPVEGLRAGRNFRIFRPDVSVLVFSGKDGILFWFLFEDRKSLTEFKDIPRYLDEDAELLANKVADVTVSDGVVFSDVFRSREFMFMTALEEGIAENWFAGRMVLVGDSAHKMTPHAAMGANQAMESSVCLVNRLLELRNHLGGTLPRGIPVSELEKCFEKYYKKRLGRASAFKQVAHKRLKGRAKGSGKQG
ncbi:Monooxygenase FAD-binding protein [Neofusicoccum parvum]|nr:Monooxygenase FAD-binding protein [Neofusicoccum parvum]